MALEALVLEMVRPGGSGDEADADLVRAQLALFPEAILANLRDERIGVIACRDAVTDYRPDLVRKPPRGWPEGYNWNVVPGCYLPDDRTVVIATIAGENSRMIPPTGNKHGSFNLVLHEVMHADDYSAEQLRSRNIEFLVARSSDIQALTPYQRQEGAGGTEETYAESAARHFGQDPRAADCPALRDYWSNASLPVSPGPRTRALPQANNIGMFKLLANGSFELDMRGDGEHAVGGHALVVILEGDPVHDRLRGSKTRALPGELVLLEAFD